jgi:allantoinase
LVDDNLSELDDLHEAGVIGFKGFLSNSGVDFERINDDLVYAGLLRARELGNVVGLHAENEWVTSFNARQFVAAGRTDRMAWPESRQPATELEAVNRALYWAGVTGGNLHIVHVTIADAIRAAARAKEKGTHVTVETCPHYLFFNLNDYLAIGPNAKCAPPIRSREEVDALWQCVLEGLVDTIASDHSPCLTADKKKGEENIWQAWGGITGIQTMLPAVLTAGVHQRGLPLSRLVTMMSANPARIFGLYPQKGSLQPGADADIVIVDLEREWTLAADDLFSRNRHSAYTGYSFKGAVERTIVRGQTVYAGGEITVQPGYGQLLRRQYPYTPLVDA